MKKYRLHIPGSDMTYRDGKKWVAILRLPDYTSGVGRTETVWGSIGEIIQARKWHWNNM